MNGDLKELYNELDKRFTANEAVSEERWKNHGARAEELRSDIKAIFNRMSCDKHDERMKSLSGKITWIWGILGGAGVVALGVVLNHFIN